MLRVLAFLCLLMSALGRAEAEPGLHWQFAEPSSLGWSADKLRSAQALVMSGGTTALVIVQGDQVIARWGDVGRPINVRSVRKSFISSLYGIAIADGKIDRDRSLEQLGIDDRPPSLTTGEKQATVRDLLMARSGIYHDAAYETKQMKAARPERGSHPWGSFWYYNNWDFNVLGAIYRQETGEDIFASFDRRIAKPIGMESFNPASGRYVVEPASEYPAYPFRMSALDAARFGLLYLQHGEWNHRQLVPADWIAESTKAWSRTDRDGIGYGYLWWVLPKEVAGEGAYAAEGSGGQVIAIMPEFGLVVVRTVDEPDIRPHNARLRLQDLLKLIVAARR
ncbi:MAG: serine hydrolase [Ancalomicrobiaceae bacterium]|nr:serine hydrolase [Ancalomicrobiaceae bacterium]